MAATIRTPAGTAPVIPVIMIGFGAYLTWFGVHYWRTETRYPTDPIKAVLTGKAIPEQDRSGSESAMKKVRLDAQAYAGAQTSGSGKADGGTYGPVGSGGSGDKIAADALKYIGAGYVFGGNASKVGQWDCSSFVSFILGHENDLPLPGGRWGDHGMPPYEHGPTTNDYLLFGKPVAANEVKKGDLVVNSHHMGIVVTTGSYMSAQTPSAGTGLGLYTDGFPGGSFVFRRVT